MLMKRYLSIVSALCLLLGILSSCGNAKNDELTMDNDNSNGSTQASVMDMATTEATDTQPLLTEKIALVKAELYLKSAGEQYTLYTGDISVEEITWGTDNSSIATFEKGVVTAVSPGKTTVYAEYNNDRVTCVVNCDFKQTTAQNPDNDGNTGNEGNTGTTGGSRDPVKAVPSAVVDASFFDDAVFIGDSISLKLSQYASSSGELGKAKFLVVGSYGVSNAINDHPDTKLSFRGTTYKDFEEALAATGGKKVFIMLGMNDIGLYGIDKTIENWGTMLSMIHEKCPDMVVYIQSMTPVWTGGEKGKLNNDNVNKYNERLKNFANNNGYKFIDVAPYMKDTTGGLATKFCSDSYVHLTNEGAQTWIKVLKAYTGY